MNFSWTQEQLTFQQQIADFAQQELATPNLIDRDRSGTFPNDLWQRCADFGILGLTIPKKYGGYFEELDIMKAVLAMESIGYHCRDNGFVLALNAQLWTVQLPIVKFGSEEQRKDLLPRLASGEKICVHALTEPEVGSDVFAMQMRAEKTDGGYILNGKKHLITLGPLSDVAMVLASTNPKMGNWGISAFLVEKGTSGFEIGEVHEKMGMRTVPFGELTFKDCFVPKSSLLGRAGSGFSILNHSLEYDRSCAYASVVGTLQRQLEENIAFAKKRTQFGQTIGKFQSVANRIVDMKTRLEMARLLLYKSAWLTSQGKSAMLEAAMVKLQLSEAFLAGSIDTVRNFGGIGYKTETHVERDVRDAMGGVLYAGTSDIQRNIIAKLLGL
ncbi:MAG: acyl-CoA dehydrogenase family protein [Bacteroidota bacterium]